MRDKARWELQHADRVLATDPIAYWVLDEKQGGIAYDLVSGRVTGAKRGAHTGGVGGRPGIGDGRTSRLYDGIGDYTNIWSEELAGVEKVVNPGFETAGGGGADIWGTWVETAGDGALANEAVLVHAGASAAKMTAGATANTKGANSFAVVVGTTYDLSFFTRGDGANGGRYAVYDVTNGAFILPATPTGVIAAAYAQVPTRVKAPPGCVSMRLDLMCPAANGGICYFDTVSVKGTKRFNGAEGTLLVWAKVANAGVWTDAAFRTLVSIGVDSSANWFVCSKRSDGTTQWYYMAGGTTDAVTATLTSVGWMCLAATWSLSADQFKVYNLGTQVGETQTGLGTWAGSLASSRVCIGAETTAGDNVWSGSLAHCALWSKALTAAQVKYVSAV